ncbi:hypothetical protein EJ06DRAFT_105811 [Trichodelitschia bisporula]|uniref:Uncharacterized protein n=1 Tax=Trichodelitschia bisporula TaxID=703511 RepID=A0A6G1HR49_9PEZI|nr:hypothetical protein EJ06DRAFT_105811 [Trichodelitschia bisporula]
MTQSPTIFISISRPFPPKSIVNRKTLLFNHNHHALPRPNLHLDNSRNHSRTFNEPLSSCSGPLRVPHSRAHEPPPRLRDAQTARHLNLCLQRLHARLFLSMLFPNPIPQPRPLSPVRNIDTSLQCRQPRILLWWVGTESQRAGAAEEFRHA